MSDLPKPVQILGYAGLLPAALCVLLGLLGPTWAMLSMMALCVYAGLILSFLGGLWWMAALRAGDTSFGVYAMAVAPSLYAWVALLFPMHFDGSWNPTAVTLGLGLLASPLVDRALHARFAWPAGWLRLRVHLALGLGTAMMVIWWRSPV